MSVVCCLVGVSATSWSLVQGSPTVCDVSKKCMIVKPRKKKMRPKGLSSHWKKELQFGLSLTKKNDHSEIRAGHIIGMQSVIHC